MTKPVNVCFAHSGGVTTMLNASAAAFLAACKHNPDVKSLLVAKNGIVGLIKNQLFRIQDWNDSDWCRLAHTPSTVFGSCRKKLASFEDNPSDYHAIFATCRAYGISRLVYQGGNDSMDTAHKLNMAARTLGLDFVCLGIPKTIDNDLYGTDFSPGFPSAAKYLATSLYEASLDTYAMSESSTKVFIMEVMGRHAGWLAAGTAAASQSGLGPHLLLVPEIGFDTDDFLQRVSTCVQQRGFCVVVASEGICYRHDQQPVAQTGEVDAFGHAQLGGVGQTLSQLVTSRLGLKTHVAVPDYLQRSAGHLRSACDFEHAQALGKAAASAMGPQTPAVMLGLVRNIKHSISWDIQAFDLAECANHEKKLPKNFLSKDGYTLTNRARDYFEPLLAGEVYPSYNASGLPDYFSPLSLTISQPEEVS